MWRKEGGEQAPCLPPLQSEVKWHLNSHVKPLISCHEKEDDLIIRLSIVRFLMVAYSKSGISKYLFSRGVIHQNEYGMMLLGVHHIPQC